ncbi:MAG: hypothetical protein OXR67_06290 [Chloroflexota bacterium]|nr:hypothetical protein [Chloroflexota bacterium]
MPTNIHEREPAVGNGRSIRVVFTRTSQSRRYAPARKLYLEAGFRGYGGLSQ